MLHVPVLDRTKRLFYGWVIVGVGFISEVITGISFQGFATFLIPLQTEFGWSKAALAGPRSATQVETAMLGPVNGFLVDRFGAKAMMAIGAFMTGLGLVLFAFIRSLWQFYAVNLLIALGTSFAGLLVVSVAINHWFRRKRTIAMGLATTGLAVAGVFGIPLLVLMQSAFGWRYAIFASGLFVWAVGIPAAFLLRSSPEKYGLLPDGDSPASRSSPSATGLLERRAGGGTVDFTLGEALQTPAFWLITLGTSLWMLSMSAVTVHQFAHLEEGVGLSRGAAAVVLTVLNVFNIGGRLIGGLLGDRFPKNYLLGTSAFGIAVAVIILATASSFGLMLVYGALYGLCWGMQTPVVTAIRGDYFGRTAFGRISGMSQLFAAPLSIAGPVLAGLMADLQGDYRTAFLLLAVLSAAVSVLFLLAKRPTPPARPQPS